MSRTNTVREALIAEAIGDIAQLLDRLDQLLPALVRSEQALNRETGALRNQVDAFASRMAEIQNLVQLRAVQHIAQRCVELGLSSQESQRLAMAQVAQELFAKELEPALQRLVAPLDRLLRRAERRWAAWLSYGVAATIGALGTWLFLQLAQC